jgi:hypothetical protein
VTLKTGNPVRVAGNVELTTDPAAIAAQTGAADPCTCWSASGAALSCAQFDAAR